MASLIVILLSLVFILHIIPCAKTLPKSKLILANRNKTIGSFNEKLKAVHPKNYTSTSSSPSHSISTRLASMTEMLLSPPHSLAADQHASRSTSSKSSRNFNYDFIRSSAVNSQLTPTSSLLSPPETRAKGKSLSALDPYSSGKGTKKWKRANEASALDSTSEESSNLLLKLDRNYTPKEIAEYIASTGDEKGIIQVVSDMLRDGQLMASRDDVILFLETVQRELDKLKSLKSAELSRK